jgi:hypothetical protein
MYVARVEAGPASCHKHAQPGVEFQASEQDEPLEQERHLPLLIEYRRSYHSAHLDRDDDHQEYKASPLKLDKASVQERQGEKAEPQPTQDERAGQAGCMSGQCHPQEECREPSNSLQDTDERVSHHRTGCSFRR